MKKLIAFVLVLSAFVTSCCIPTYDEAGKGTVSYQKVKDTVSYQPPPPLRTEGNYDVYRCTRCHGKKQEVCESCKGYGFRKCLNCYGSGQVQCNDWNHTVQTCTVCNGTGVGGGCNDCLMTGLVNCPVCNGTGEIKKKKDTKKKQK